MDGFFSKKETESESRPDGKVYSCTSCGLYKSCNSPKMKPQGGFKKKIMNIGEFPTFTNDEEGKCWNDKYGRVLKSSYRSVGINLHEDCININAVNCYPGKKTPTSYEIDCCRKIVLNAIEQYKPHIIVLFGDSPLYTILKNHWKKDLGTITKWRGFTIPDQHFKAWVIPTFSPTKIVQHDRIEALTIWKLDLQKVADKVNQPLPIYKEPEIKYIKDLAILDTIKEGVIAFDFETTGIKPHADAQKIKCASVAVDENLVYTFEIPDKKKKKAPFIRLMQNPKIGKMAHNMKFEDHWTNVKLGTHVNNWNWDSQLAAHILDNRSGITSLKFQTFVHFGIADYDSEINPYLKGIEDKNANSLNRIDEIMATKSGTKKVLKYCAYDSIYQYRLANIQKKEIYDSTFNLSFPKAYKLFHDGILALAKAERQGFCIDVKYTEKRIKKLTAEISEIEKKFQSSKLFTEWKKSTTKAININSSDQLGKFLYISKNIKPKKLTTSGKGSTDEEALSLLNIPELDYLLRAKKLKKARDTYLKGFLREQVNGALHPFYNLNTVTTYRSSCNNPNFQNIPKRDKEVMEMCRKAITARPGHQLLEVDFSGLEVHIGACYHKDSTMLKYIKDPTTDMHRDMAQELFKIKKFDKTDKTHSYLRSATKNGFVFPQFYGDYYKNCAEGLVIKWGQMPESKWKKTDGVEFEDTTLGAHLISHGITSFSKYVEHVKKIEIDFWGNRFKEYDRWRDLNFSSYQKNGYVPMKTGFITQGLQNKKDTSNYPVQGAAFHCLLWCFIRATELLDKKKMDTKIIGQIHDSIILDVNPNELKKILKIMRKITCIELPKAFDWINVPLNVDAELYPVDGNWSEKQDIQI